MRTRLVSESKSSSGPVEGGAKYQLHRYTTFKRVGQSNEGDREAEEGNYQADFWECEDDEANCEDAALNFRVGRENVALKSEQTL